jgi:hypothetical protein
VRTFIPGRNFLNSISQLRMTEVGTIIRCCPQIPLSQARWARREMVWIVFLFCQLKPS